MRPSDERQPEREEQVVWFSVDPEGLVAILQSNGPEVSAAVAEFGLKSHIEIPTEPGLYVWEGFVAGHGPVMSDPPVDADSWWEGETRVCDREDVEAMALSLCLETAAERTAKEAMLSHLIAIGRAVAGGEDPGEEPFHTVVERVRKLAEMDQAAGIVAGLLRALVLDEGGRVEVPRRSFDRALSGHWTMRIGSQNEGAEEAIVVEVGNATEDPGPSAPEEVDHAAE